MNYLLKRGNRYYLNRKVPTQLKDYDSRKFVRISLKTDSRKEATRLMVIHNDKLEHYWKELVRNGQRHDVGVFEKVVSHARLFGFSYLSNADIATMPLMDIHKRLESAGRQVDNVTHVAAVLGGMKEPQLKLNEVLPKFISYASSRTMNKSANQIRKWMNPRKLTMKTFIACVGNKEFSQVNRDDILKYREWWIGRVESGNALAATANKNLINIKNIIETVSDNLNTKLDTAHLFKKIILPDRDEIRRLPFDNEYIVSTLLNPDNLKGLNDQAKWVLHAIAETGAGISEQVGLMPEDIVLDCDIPHIIIQPRQKKALKTKYRKRVIPLVGFALDAFRACSMALQSILIARTRFRQF